MSPREGNLLYISDIVSYCENFKGADPFKMFPPKSGTLYKKYRISFLETSFFQGLNFHFHFVICYTLYKILLLFLRKALSQV